MNCTVLWTYFLEAGQTANRHLKSIATDEWYF